MHPASTVLVLKQQLPKRHLGTPGRGPRLVLDVLDVGGKNPTNHRDMLKAVCLNTD